MKKTSLFGALALLLVFSCSKTSLQEPVLEEPIDRLDPWTYVNTPAKPAETGAPLTINAGFPETKSHFEMNAGGTYGSVLWKAGDTFKMYETGNYYAVFSNTSGAGAKATFTTEHSLTTPPFHSFHNVPSLLMNAGKTLFGFEVPAEQTAVAGGIADELNYSYAKSATFNSSDADLTFHNMLALVRFKISGSLASSVTSVTLRGAVPLAGNCTMPAPEDDIPVLSLSAHFSGYEAVSNTVTLSGTFAEDTYYYFAVVPGKQSGLVLTFSDGANTTTKVGSKEVEFKRGRVADLGTLNIGTAWTTPSTATITWNTASAVAPKPVTIAVIPDGFTAAELPKYEMLAKAAMNTLFNVEPFKSYKEYFNVYILKVASEESGARISNGTTAEQSRKCYFESSWPSNSYSTMAANQTKITNFVTDNCPDIVSGKHTINEVPILMIINDSRYGGICRSWSDGFAYCMAPYTYEGGGLSWSYPNVEAVSDSDPLQGTQATSTARYTEVGSNSGNWLNTMVHEFGGHCFSKLADEYWYDDEGEEVSYISEHRWDNPPYNGVPFSLNVSATYANPGYDDPGLGAAYIKQGWQHLIDMKTDPTYAAYMAARPQYSRIGVYQGGAVFSLHRWRSERVSCMIDNRFYFSTFQRELIVKRIMSLAGESFSFDSFLAKDVAIDPVRDVISSPVMGVEDPIPPRPVPLLPPPVLTVN